MSAVLSTSARLPLPATASPTCLLWGFPPAQLKFLSQMISLASFRATTVVLPKSSQISLAVAPPEANLGFLPPKLAVIRADFSHHAAPLPGVFQLPCELNSFLARVDYLCYPPKANCINVFGLTAGAGCSSVAFGLANTATNSVYVDASSSDPQDSPSGYSPGLRRLGFPAIPEFSSISIEGDLLVSRLGQVLPRVGRTRFLSLGSRNPRHISYISSLLSRAFSLVIWDWGQLKSEDLSPGVTGKNLVIADYRHASENRYYLRLLRQTDVLIVTNRAPKKFFLSKSRSGNLSLTNCRELKHIQRQGLGLAWTGGFQNQVTRLLQTILEDAR